MDGKGRNVKGSSRERYFSKVLSKWSGERVMRTLSSGAGGTRAVSEIRMTGDLFFPLGSTNCFSYEVKDHASTRLQHVFNNNGDIPSFWQQAVTDARRLKNKGIVPVLLFHISRENNYVLIPYKKEFYKQLCHNHKPAQVQVVSFPSAKGGQPNQFLTILTDIDGLTSVDAHKLFDLYRGMDYDVLNHMQSTGSISELDKIVDNALESER